MSRYKAMVERLAAHLEENGDSQGLYLLGEIEAAVDDTMGALT